MNFSNYLTGVVDETVVFVVIVVVVVFIFTTVGTACLDIEKFGDVLGSMPFPFDCFFAIDFPLPFFVFNVLDVEDVFDCFGFDFKVLSAFLTGI